MELAEHGDWEHGTPVAWHQMTRLTVICHWWHRLIRASLSQAQLWTWKVVPLWYWRGFKGVWPLVIGSSQHQAFFPERHKGLLTSVE
jgi:hypothetical protein